MSILVGIDEAGFGPLLGPLVVSAVVLSVPEEAVDADLWQVLRKSLAPRGKHRGGRLLIDDSKKAYSKSTGIKHLERTALAVLQCLGHCPRTVQDLIAVLDRKGLERLRTYPWYQDIDRSTVPSGDPDKSIAASVLAQDLAQNRMQLLAIRTRCIDVAFYNHLIDTMRNKSSVLFSITCSLIQESLDLSLGKSLEVQVDRQGGRSHYRGVLQTMFADRDMTIIREDEDVSAYCLSRGSQSMRIHFVVGADGRFMPVALASMVSKYVREVLMDRQNAYFAGLCEDLRPTAGYWQDGLRFIEDLKAKLPHIQVEPEMFIRSR